MQGEELFLRNAAAWAATLPAIAPYLAPDDVPKMEFRDDGYSQSSLRAGDAMCGASVMVGGFAEDRVTIRNYGGDVDAILTVRAPAGPLAAWKAERQAAWDAAGDADPFGPLTAEAAK